MKMKKYVSFDAYFADQSATNQAIIRALRALAKRTARHLEESVKWGNGVWLAGTRPVAFVYSRPEYVEFGFFRATSLDDPDGLLEGKGAFVRHVKMRKPADVKRPGVAKLLRAAARR
jgi:hypothetical protein